jgi:hypothetical protein
MAGDERGKGGFGMIPGILAQQGQVVVRHLTGISPPPGKGNNLFCDAIPKRRRAAALQNAGAKVGRVTPRAPPWQTRTRSLAAGGAQGAARPTGALAGCRQAIDLFHFLHHQHFDGHVGWHQFKTRLIQ